MRKFTHKCKSVSRVATPIALAIMLAACSSDLSTVSSSPSDITATASASSNYYLLQAESTQGEQQANWLLLASKALFNEGNYNKSATLVVRLAKMPLTPLQLSEWQLLRAMLLQQKGSYQAALDNLNFQPSWTLPALQYQRYHQLKAALYQQAGNQAGAVLATAQAFPYITSKQEKQANVDALWAMLMPMPQTQLDALTKSNYALLIDWIDLIKVLRTQTGSPASQKEALLAWLAKNPAHPANQFLPNNLTSLQQMPLTRPERIGILLPLTQKFSEQGLAIRDGFLQAMLDQDPNNKASVQFYDTNALPMTEILQTMQRDGIQFVIGPLQKNKVDEFVQLNNNGVLSLAMNMPQQEGLYNPNVCFFTLSPEQEAAQAAAHIAAKGHKYPLVIAPKNEFGQRVSKAFADAWRTQGGEAVQIDYFANVAAIQKTVQRAFGLQESQARIQQLNQALGQNFKAEPRSRRDIDAVYLAASASELTLLKPFIDVAINPGVATPKLYASSRSNNNVRGVSAVGELKGVEFSDIPLLIYPDTAVAAKFHQLWPNMNSNMARLYALGMDAYGLIEGLPQMRATSDFSYDGQSGQLSLGAGCVLQRQLPWATFGEQGFVATVPLPQPAQPMAEQPQTPSSEQDEWQAAPDFSQ